LGVEEDRDASLLHLLVQRVEELRTVIDSGESLPLRRPQARVLRRTGGPAGWRRGDRVQNAHLDLPRVEVGGHLQERLNHVGRGRPPAARVEVGDVLLPVLRGDLPRTRIGHHRAAAATAYRVLRAEGIGRGRDGGRLLEHQHVGAVVVGGDGGDGSCSAIADYHDVGRLGPTGGHGKRRGPPDRRRCVPLEPRSRRRGRRHRRGRWDQCRRPCHRAQRRCACGSGTHELAPGQLHVSDSFFFQFAHWLPPLPNDS